MKESFIDKLERIKFRLEELNELMSEESATDDMSKFTLWTKEHSEISPLVEDYLSYCAVIQNISDAKALMCDPDMRILAETELLDAESRKTELEESLRTKLLPKDENDNRNVFLEIRAGTGGDESALFAADLLRMYAKFAELRKWKVEIVSQNQSDLGGYKEIVCKISGQDVYSWLKFESGGHRVQRVPETETQGRVHTSACTVAVLPEADELHGIEINPADIRIDTFRASGAGGQHVNKTDSAIRITHIPSGLVVECQDDRSQHKNKAQALSVLSAKLNDMQLQEQQKKEAETRKTLIGSGDRSQRIRTYNFPQGRLTDHRINLTLYKLSQVLEGEIDEVIGSLRAEYQAEMLALAES